MRMRKPRRIVSCNHLTASVCPRFHRAGPLTTRELERLLDMLIARITRALARSGALITQEYDDAQHPWLDLDPDGEVGLREH